EDTDDNAADFTASSPSPGRANRAQIDLAVQIVNRRRWLPLPAALDTRVEVPIRFSNRGVQPMELADVALWIGGNLERTPEGILEPAMERVERYWVRLPAEPGLSRIEVHGVLARDENPDQNRDSLRIAVGASPLWMSEVHPRPLDGPEWV